jgi:hypothetical protein
MALADVGQAAVDWRTQEKKVHAHEELQKKGVHGYAQEGVLDMQRTLAVLLQTLRDSADANGA